MAKRFLTIIQLDDGDNKKTPTISKVEAKQQQLEDKYLGKEVKPNLIEYWELPNNQDKQRRLFVDVVRYSDLGTGCEKTLMFHFEGDPPNKFEIAKHFTLCK